MSSPPPHHYQQRRPSSSSHHHTSSSPAATPPPAPAAALPISTSTSTATSTPASTSTSTPLPHRPSTGRRLSSHHYHHDLQRPPLAPPSSSSPDPGNDRVIPAAPALLADDDVVPDAESVETADAPLSMAASVVLRDLPRDASAALEGAGRLGREKVTIRLQPISSAPILTRRVFQLSATAPFSTVVSFLRKKLRLEPAQSVFCYINNVFAPQLDVGVGELWRCFRVGEELVVGYSMGVAFG